MKILPQKVILMKKFYVFQSVVIFVLLTASCLSLADQERQFEICKGNESKFVDMIGGAALGSSITASVAGHSVILIVAEGAALIVSAPAVAPAMATSAAVGSAAYVFMKGYCNSEIVSDVAADLYDATKNGVVDTINIVAGTYKIALQQQSENIGIVKDIHEIAVQQQSEKMKTLEKKVKETWDKIKNWF